MVISHQLSRRSVISTSVPSCSTKRSVADLSGELFTAVESDITTACVSSSISRRSPTANQLVSMNAAAATSVP